MSEISEEEFECISRKISFGQSVLESQKECPECGYIGMRFVRHVEEYRKYECRSCNAVEIRG